MPMKRKIDTTSTTQAHLKPQEPAYIYIYIQSGSQRFACVPRFRVPLEAWRILATDDLQRHCSCLGVSGLVGEKKSKFSSKVGISH